MNDHAALLEAAIAKAGPRSKLRKEVRRAGVKHSVEFQRIIELPQRVWTEEEARALVSQLTALLKTPNGAMILRPAQAIALLEIGMYRKLLGPLRVGAGKTLITLLAAYMLNSVRPLLVLPANAIGPTQERQRILSEHFRIPYWLHYVSYESLGRKSHEKFLEELRPDSVILDEAHMAANPQAAVTRRLRRYKEGDKSTGLLANDVPYLPVSGTLTKRSVKNYAHLARWGLGEYSPVPRAYGDIEQWSDVIDERPGGEETDMKPGALTWFSNGIEDRTAIRQGFAKHMIQVPGVVATFDEGPSMSLEVHRYTVPMSRKVIDAFYTLRADWATPEGLLLMGGLEKNRMARQIAMGFYYRWTKPAPIEWLKWRKAWHQFVRHTLQYNRQGLDSEATVALACVHGRLDRSVYDQWVAVREDFKPETEAVWIDGYAVEAAARWSAKHGGIIFCEHIEFANMLSELTGLPYCGKDARDADGVHIEAHAGKPIIASLHSCHKIWNLQAWDRALVAGPPSNGSWSEQLLGRMHRDGQTADLVRYDFLTQCLEHSNGVAQARRDAGYVNESQLQTQKLGIADWRWPEVPEDGVQWNKEIPKLPVEHYYRYEGEDTHGH
jgi:hypothetical protein